MTDQQLADLFLAAGYFRVRKLADGRWIGLQQFMFTIGLCVDLSAETTCYQTRFCYEKEYSAHAVAALLEWDGVGDPPGPWLKQKGNFERMNPNHPKFKGIPITTQAKQ